VTPPPDFGPFVWSLAFAVDFRDSGGDVGRAWAVGDEAWTRYRERAFGGQKKVPGRPAPRTDIKRRKK
jgi:hypothetical protein